MVFPIHSEAIDPSITLIGCVGSWGQLNSGNMVTNAKSEAVMMDRPGNFPTNHDRHWCHEPIGRAGTQQDSQCPMTEERLMLNQLRFIRF
jgi:hypothetical protein